MKRLFIVLVASLVLGLVGGVGNALAGGLLPPPPETTQTATQSNDGSNSADQSATSQPVVTSGPNIAIANGSSCSPCGGSATTTQNSGNNVDASASNTAKQSNTQANDAGQTQAVGGGSNGDTSQSLDQSNKADNTATQEATSKPVVVSGPNVAILNKGDVDQNSGNNVDASASNDAKRSNNQTNGAGQSQTVSGGSCCHSGGDTSQTASQSNDASNSADQTAKSEPVVVSSGNYAILNNGDVDQNSGNNVDASASNTAKQSNTQQNSAGQSQTVAGGHSCCSKGSDTSQSADQSNSASNSADQSAYSAPVVVSGPNVAVANGWGGGCGPCGDSSGSVSQNSGNNVWAPASNRAYQTNNQSNDLGQTQTVTGGSGCCSHGDVEQTASQYNTASNDASQNAKSEPVVTSGWNGSAFNHGPATQNSGNNVNASTSNTAKQGNDQSNSLGQSQTVRGNGCCKEDCHPSCPRPCKPRCERPCKPKCEQQCKPKCDSAPALTRGLLVR
jgi:clumping factor A